MKALLIKISLLICPALIFWGFNAQNIPLGFSLQLGLLLFPFVIRVREKPGGYRYALLAAISGGILLFFRSSSLYYLSSIFIALFILEQWWGKLNNLPILLLLAISPLSSNIVYTWSFPIRIQLSQLASQTLQAVKMNVEAEGNMIYLDGQSFSVDPACVGLKMMIVSFVLGLVIMAFFEKKYRYNLKFYEAGILLLSIFAGAIISNFIRLLTLIIFQISPDNPMHDLVGLLSLGLYVLLPFYFIVKYIFEKKRLKENWIAPFSPHLLKFPSVPAWAAPTLVFLLFLQVLNGRQFLELPAIDHQALQTIKIKDFNNELTDKGILKFHNEEALVYVKPPVKAFQGSHDPRICWEGSGYQFSKVQIEQIGGRLVYTALLNKGKDQIFSAWWYANGDMETPYEWAWRWENLKGGKPFYLINVSFEDREKLVEWIKQDNVRM